MQNASFRQASILYALHVDIFSAYCLRFNKQLNNFGGIDFENILYGNYKVLISTIFIFKEGS